MHILAFPKIVLVTVLIIESTLLSAQHSSARKWNEINLEAIRNDFARPTVHARNLFHVSAAMYDAWAIFNKEADTYLIGNTIHDYTSDFDGFVAFSGTDEENIEKALSYAAYRIIEHRYARSPKRDDTFELIEELLDDLELDPSFESVAYQSGSAAALGNYIAQEYIAYGLQDGANESNDYVNEYYEAVNPPLFPEQIALDSIQGNPTIIDPNRWQPLQFSTFIDQSGEITDSATPDFLSPEWGNVDPFSMSEDAMKVYQRDGFEYKVYHDPGPPPYHDSENDPEGTALYQWNFSLVAIWSAHLDANFDKEVDISPLSIGDFDIVDLPKTFEEYDQFYGYLSGGDASSGRSLNPITNQSYIPQIVKLGDYGRVLAEFWADGPDSETPPGHWFTLLNYVSDNIDKKRFNGIGESLSDLEWDIKSYFLLGGAMHDVAIAAWSVKGWYDYIRPISAIRYMADLGQSSHPEGVNYHPGGIPLVTGYIEQISSDDPTALRGSSGENIGKIKLYAWRGPGSIEDPFIINPETDIAGVDWILADQWWPYQRPTFITPPFAGYVSGHSTYSRAAAEVLTAITGSPFFPGGMGEFKAPKNDFLVFEDGPSEDITLQWATYYDASDQCSLSRIWGGIHPPADDLHGRIMGQKIGTAAFEFGQSYFNKIVTHIDKKDKRLLIYPNPTSDHVQIVLPNQRDNFFIDIFDLRGTKIMSTIGIGTTSLNLSDLKKGNYIITIIGEKWRSNHFINLK